MVEMADGFDTYTAAQITRYYPGATLTSGVMATGYGGVGQSIHFQGNASTLPVTVTARTEYYFGFDYQAPSGSSASWLIVKNSLGTILLTLSGAGTAAPLIVNGTSFANVLTGTWQSFVVYIKCDPTNGIIKVTVDGVVIYNGTGLNTGSVGITTFTYNSGNLIDFFIDNFWIFNTLGTHSNTAPVGRIRVGTLYPSSDGSFQGFTPSSGTNHYTKVNQAQPDDDTSYVYSNVPAADTYGIQSLSPTGVNQVHAVQIRAVYKKDDVNAKVLHIVARSGLIISESPDLSPPTAYTSSAYLIQDDPNTGQQWLIADVNAMEIGIKEIS